jgi:predicted Zn-dependent protease
MITIFEKKEQRKKRAIYFKYALFFIFFSLKSYTQDSIPIAKDLTEEKELNFQQFFFKALSEKSIGNYQKSIENLESCNQILTDNVAVFFEFSKNYLLLNKTLLAKEYINRALLKEPNNIWMLKHLVKVYLKDNNYSEAIPVQLKVVAIDIKEREKLLKMYLQNRNYKKAVALMNAMEYDNALSSYFKNIKNKFDKVKSSATLRKNNNATGSLKEQFKNNKSFVVLKQILVASKNNSEELLKYSEEGILLYPAQPFVYLMKGKALNYKKEYKKALLSLQNGIDFVIEDKIEVSFYKEMAIAYKGLGNLKEAKKFIEKSKKNKN